MNPFNSLFLMSPHRVHLKPALLRSLLVGVLSTASLWVGLTPNLQTHSLRWEFGAIANAQQTFSDDDIQAYAQSILEIEPIRRRAYDEIKRLLGSADVPPIACHRPSSFNSLDRNIRQIAVNYCHDSMQIVERIGLPSERFNAITTALQSDSALANRVQQELIQLQQSPSANQSR